MLWRQGVGMRRLSEGVEAALHCALVLGALPEGKVISGKDLARMFGVSESYLLKHLRAMVSADVATAVPGPRGGFRLARPAGQVTMLDVVEAIDGKGPAFVCREIRQSGATSCGDPRAYPRDCLVKQRMMQAEDAWRQVLAAQTLADLAREAAPDIDPRDRAAIAAYVAWAQR